MPEIKQKYIAVICDYELKPDRIGGMDRFFVAFDAHAKKEGYIINWFFKGNSTIEFYNNATIYLTAQNSVQLLFLKHLNTSKPHYDYIITHFTELCSKFYKEINKKTNTYCIAVDHNPRPLEGFPLKKRLKLKLKGLLYSRYIDQFIAVSKYTKHHILNDYGHFLNKKVSVIYNGIDTSVYKKQESRGSKRFIVASHLRHSKGIQDLLTALSQLSPTNLKELTIDIYGEGPMEQELKALSKHYKLQDVVSFKGSSSELPNLFHTYDYMIQPTYMECFSLSLLESLSANVPVITTQVGGNLELIIHGENGFVFQAGDVKAFATLLRSIFNEEKSISNDVYQLVNSQFGLERMVNTHLNLIKKNN
jgi:glycosyltransferase involved in cell wall biosynthesis